MNLYKRLTKLIRKPFVFNWLPKAGDILTTFPQIVIPYNPLLMHTIWPKNKPTPTAVLLKKAEKYAEMLNKKEVKSKAELARKTGVNRARITQIMNLLKLAPEIQGYLKNLTDPLQIQYLTAKRLRPITNTEDHQEQIRKFEELKRRMKSKSQFTEGIV